MSEQGVSPVVAAVLLFALFSTGFILWSTTQVPEWIADREESHLDEVQKRFAALHADIESLSATGESGPLSTDVPLAPEPIPVLQSTDPTGELAFIAGTWFNLTVNGAAIHMQGGTTLGSPDEPIDGDVMANVEDLLALRLALTTSGITTSSHAGITVVATDGTETVTAVWSQRGYAVPDSALAGPHSCESGTSEMHLRVSSTVVGILFDETLTCGHGSAVTGITLDLMRPEFSWRAAIERLGPASITLTDGVYAGAGSVTGTAAGVGLDAQGRHRLLGSGVSAGTYDVDHAGGSLRHRPHLQSFLTQLISLEGGGVLIDQGDAAVMAIDPAFDVSVQGGVGYLRWTLATLSGTGALSGPGTATVTATHVGTTELVLTGTDAHIQISSDAASGWRSFWGERTRDMAGSATVGGVGRDATLDLNGATQWVIHLRIISAQIAIT